MSICLPVKITWSCQYIFSPDWIFTVLVRGFSFFKVRTTALHVCKTVMKRRRERQLNHNMEGFEWEVEAACLINP